VLSDPVTYDISRTSCGHSANVVGNMTTRAGRGGGTPAMILRPDLLLAALVALVMHVALGYDDNGS
jgi:hypothetical protein